MKYVMFGVGGGGKRFYEIMNNVFQMKIDYIIDNNPKIKEYCGVPVIKASDFFQQYEPSLYHYIITSVYRADIEKQLFSYGVSQKQIFGKIDIVIENLSLYLKKIDIGKNRVLSDRTLFFDCGCGFVLGGVEKWTYNLSRELKNEGYKVILLSDSSDNKPPKDLRDNSLYTLIEHFEDFSMDSIMELVDILLSNMPCTVFTAHVNNLLLASMLVKTLYPNQIKVISVIHGGLDYVLRDNIKISDYIDYIFSVSYDAQKNIVSQSNLNIDKVLFKETPIEIQDISCKKYNLKHDTPVRIAYASRLEKQQKHAELLPELIEELEAKGVNYILDIAGDGSLYGFIDEYIQQNNYTEKVNLLGKVEYSKMPEFWLNHDVAINLSEYEGCALTMLESMSAGAVPVFTNVDSTEYFIHDGKNGFITEYGDVKAMAERIFYLSKNRELIKELGECAHAEVKQKCNMESYVDFMKNIIEK